MQIQILTSGVQTKTNKQGKPYQSLEVNYKNLTFGKVESKQLFSFGAQADAYKALTDSKSGDVFEVEVVKNAQGYNDWVKATQAAPGAAQNAVAAQGTINGAGKTLQVKSTYETPEERALKQVYIVRQSSVSNAINMLTPGAKSPLKLGEVLEVADELFAWVMQNDVSAKQDVMSLPNDIDVE